MAELRSIHNGLKALMHFKSQTTLTAQVSLRDTEGDDSSNKKTHDKCVYCNILVPYVSSSGRISRQSLKAKEAESLSLLEDRDLVGLSDEPFCSKSHQINSKRSLRKQVHSIHRSRKQQLLDGPPNDLQFEISASGEIEKKIHDQSSSNETKEVSIMNQTGDDKEVMSIPKDKVYQTEHLQNRLHEELIMFKEVANSLSERRQKSMLTGSTTDREGK